MTTAELPRRLRFRLRLSGWRPSTAIALGVLGLTVLMAFIPGVIAPYDPNAIDLGATFRSPSADHLLGTDNNGRDVFSRIVHGAGISLAIGVSVVLFSTVVGGGLGLVAGFRGGWVDEVIMRITDVFLSVPYILLPMVVVVALQPSLVNTTIALAAVWWPSYARLMRGQVVSVRRRPYVDSAIVLGVPTRRILLRHVLPNAMGPVVVLATTDVGFVILASAGLGFLGLGARPPTPEWGVMTSDGLGFLLDAWWYSLFPGLAIAVVVLAFTILGDNVGDRLARGSGGQKRKVRQKWSSPASG
ncbi:ABC transporter permease [Actinosynnema sp. NPDC047251]|uniref:ABC-type transporter, permease subunit n=1 Tax=Saccharothrix espanaensis (strain ATCC 51144 / DSM 44229 / JCM 9112 / NBRC 15066 / NRRL 15764) TaxID=1179773 RepID=K0K5U3_SACES|nr:ABC transporter permease [Saccharothrix espanaensis]CCH31933.1 ABC-type transporter, permease subunit [Saccharothrix espanaensis DSM 44229]